MSYSDILSMPIYERRFFLGQLVKQKVQADEISEQQREQAKTNTGKGQRTTRVSGTQLKNKIKSGEIANK